MAQFRGTLNGQRGVASRLGSKSSGLTVTCNGWNLGVRVEAAFINGQDVFRVYRTGGSNRGQLEQLIAEVKREPEFEPMPSDPKPARQPRAPRSLTDGFRL